MENRRSLLLPSGAICIKPRIVCPFKPRVLISRTNKNPPSLRLPMAVYPPAVARRALDSTLFIIKPQPAVPTNIFQTDHREYLSDTGSTPTTGEIQSENRKGAYRQSEGEIQDSQGLLAGHAQDPGTDSINNERRSLLAEYLSRFTADSSSSTKVPQVAASKTDNSDKWETAITDGKFNPESLLAGYEHQPLYTKPEPSTKSENNQTEKLLAILLSGAAMDSSQSAKELQCNTQVNHTETSKQLDEVADGGNSCKPERLVSGNGPIGWPSCYINSSEKPQTVIENNQTTRKPAGTPELLTSHPCIKRPRPSQDSPDMILDCGEYLAEVTVESTPSNEEPQADVNLTAVLEQGQNAMNESNGDHECYPPSYGLDLTTDSEANEMENLLEVSQFELEQAVENSAQESTEEEDVDLFETLGALKRKGICYRWLIKCPIPYCNKVGPYYGMDNHYMMVHANTAIVDETPYFKFLRTT